MSVSLSDSGNSLLSLNSYSSSITGSFDSIPSYSDSIAICPKYTFPNDILPSYSPTVPLYGLCLVQVEFHSPYHSNNKRSFEPMLVELNSTQLILYKMKCGKSLHNLLVSLFKYNNVNDLKNLSSKAKRHLKSIDKHYNLLCQNRCLFEPITDFEYFQTLLKTYKCEEFKCLTLQNLQIGIAPCLEENPNMDPIVLVKYNNCLRVRIELNQLLLQFWSFHGLVEWYRNLVIGKDLCDHKTVTNFKSLPSLGIYRELMDEDEYVRNNNQLEINGYKFYINNTYSNKEIKLLKYCIPDLNSYDEWKTLVISNYDRFEFSCRGGNLYINYQKLDNSKNFASGLNRCRSFSVEQEGLVSLSCHQGTNI